MIGRATTLVLALVATIAALVVVPVGAHATTPATVRGTAATSVRRTTVLTKAGHLRAKYTVASTRRGRCWTTSLENGRLYRCMGGDLVMDPCWKEAGRHSVVCLPAPWRTKVARLRLTRHLPATSRSRPRLWGLRIGDGVGARCTANQGASFKVGGKWVSYYCQRGWVLTGRPDRSTPQWTMSTARKVGGHYRSRGVKHLSVAWKPVVH